MKKIFFATAFAAASFVSHAQFSIAPRIGFGITDATISSKSGSTTTSYKSKNTLGFNVGAEVRYRLIDALSIHSGLFYQYLAPKFEIKGGSSTTTENIKLNYISLPIALVYGKREGFYGGAGINLAYGISGKVTGEYKDSDFPQDNETINVKIKFDGKKAADATDGKAHLKGLNTGLILKAGYSFGNVFVGADAIIGLSNLNPNSGSSFKTSSYGIHIGYVFGGGSSSAE
ncbi:MAG: PorT family protein [Sphingobacteriales bacterium]|nr:PorT family protein [Sphingobacteriales bacterium]